MAQETETPSERVAASPAAGRGRASIALAVARRALRWALPAVVLCIVVVPAWLDARRASAGRARAGVAVLGISAEDKSALELTREVSGRARALERLRLTVRVANTGFDVDPLALAFRVDVPATVRRVLAVGGEGGALSRWLGYWKRYFRPATVPLVASFEKEKLSGAVLGWEVASISDRPFSGGIQLGPTGVTALPPRGGRLVERRGLEALLLTALVSERARSVTLPLVSVPAPLPASAAEDVARLARGVLAGAIVLRSTEPPATLTLSPSELGPLLRAEPAGARLRVVLDGDGLGHLLERTRRELEREPVNAKFSVDAQGTIAIEPSRPGLRVDMARVAGEILGAAATPERSGALPLVLGPEPALDTGRAERLGIRSLVSTFTTRHPCCERRVENIHRIADILDGTVVEPGQTVSVNALVGPRTAKNGFIPAPTIEEGEIVDSVGGGISQFATTIFNALFHGGYDIIERQPHTYWFPRYPMGHEATLSWPKPDIIFRNDTAAGLLIKTAYTGTSITVRLYGDNGGRKVRASVSPRKDVVDAPLELLPNPKIPPDEEKVKEPGSIGWSVIVSRELTFSDGTKKEERRKVTYKARPRRVEVHPCRIPRGDKGYTGERCPEPADVEELPPAP